MRADSRPARFRRRLSPMNQPPRPWTLAPSGEWCGRAEWCASRDGFIGLAAFLADLRSAPPPVASQPALAATQGGTAANHFAGLLSCHGDAAGTADLPSLTDLWDHNGPGRTPASTAIGTGACLGVTKATATDRTPRPARALW